MLGDLVSLAIAQVYGSTQLTIGTAKSGNFNNSDVMMFMKNIGGAQAKWVNLIFFGHTRTEFDGLKPGKSC